MGKLKHVLDVPWFAIAQYEQVGPTNVGLLRFRNGRRVADSVLPRSPVSTDGAYL